MSPVKCWNCLLMYVTQMCNMTGIMRISAKYIPKKNRNVKKYLNRECIKRGCHTLGKGQIVSLLTLVVIVHLH